MLQFSKASRVFTGFGILAAFAVFEATTSFPAQARLNTNGICAMQIGGQSYDLPTCPQRGR